MHGRIRIPNLTYSHQADIWLVLWNVFVFLGGGELTRASNFKIAHVACPVTGKMAMPLSILRNTSVLCQYGFNQYIVPGLILIHMSVLV